MEIKFMAAGIFKVTTDHLSGKPGNVREFYSCQENVRKLTKSPVVLAKNYVTEHTLIQTSYIELYEYSVDCWRPCYLFWGFCCLPNYLQQFCGMCTDIYSVLIAMVTWEKQHAEECHKEVGKHR